MSGLPARKMCSMVPVLAIRAETIHREANFDRVRARGFGQYPVVEQCAQSVFSLPMHAYLTTEEADRVVDALLE